MPLSLGSLLRSPSDLVAAARSVLGWTDEAVQVVADLPARVAALVDEVERLVARVGDTLDQVDATVERVNVTVDAVDATVGRVDATVDAVNATVGRVDATVERVNATVDAVDATVGRVDTTVGRVNATVDAVDATVDRVDAAVERVGGVAGNAEQVVAQIIPITGAADAVLESVGATSAGAQALLEIFEPIVERGGPLLRHFVDEFSVQELQALIRLVDQVPQFTEHMEADIMPVLSKLDQVGPDVHELLDVLKDVRLAIQGLPGFSLLRRRGADREEELAEERDS